MPAASHLNSVAVVFASGTAEQNRAMLEHFTSQHAAMRLCVVAEFQPGLGEWIAWHPHRAFDQNLELVKTALAGRRIASAAVAFDSRSALEDLRKAGLLLAPDVVVAYDEDIRASQPGAMRSFLLRRALSRAFAQFQAGGRAYVWLRRIVHPSEAEIPLRARAAQARGVAAAHTRANGADTPMPLQAGLRSGVSVVVPTRDGMELLRTMLPPLLRDMDSGEVIVVNNGSSDATAEWLAREHPDVRVLHHSKPLSFARAVNAGLREARFTRTLLLNNDMIVEPGFVGALDRAFDEVPDLFSATAQILFPPGVRREETGKAVWRHEGPLDFPVRCDEPCNSEDLTWVLYGSGGCSLFDTEKLASLGGVSELYEPAYVEDMDFGFRAWKRGWPSVYCANARVEHRHRSTTSRFYSERQIDFFVEQNYLRFVANAVTDSALFQRLWLEGVRRLQLQAMNGRGAALDTLRAVPAIGSRPPAGGGHLSEEEILALTNGDVAAFPGRKHTERTRVLIASPNLPFPLSHGGAVRMYNLMKLAAEDHELILIAFSDHLQTPPEELLAMCSEIVVVRRHGSHYRRDTARPDVVEEFESATLRACLKQAVHQWQPHIAQLEFTWMAQYAEACRPAKTILVEHDVTFDLQEQLLAVALAGGPARLELEQQLVKWRTFETAAWKEVDCVVTMSAKDSGIVMGARSVDCLPNGVDCERFAPVVTEPEPRRLLLIGSFAHLPNLLALDFFLREVWPLLEPGYRLHVIGGARHEYYLDFFRDRISLDLTQDGIELEGFVSDVRSAYTRAEIVLAPLTASAGTNIKVLEAMAMGKAIVSTPAGVNGLDVVSGKDVDIAETSREMADRIGRISSDTARRKALEQNARETALRYDWRAIGERQRLLYERLLR